MVGGNNFTWVDYVVFVGLLAGSSSIGIYFWVKEQKRGANNKNYLIGDRNLAVIPVALSLAASFMSTNTILGAPAEVYLLGSQFWVNMIAFFVAIMLATYVFMPVYYDLELVSINKYLLRRFGSNAVRLAGSIGFVLATLPYMGVVLYGPSLALNAVTPLSMTVSIWVVGAICTFYTTIGGIKAVIWTDVIQCFLMIFGLLMVVCCGIYDFGLVKPFEILAKGDRLILFNFTWDIHRSDVFWSVFLGTLSGWTGVYCVKQTQIQRYCCLESKAKARKALWIHLPVTMSISYLAMYCGVILYAEYHDCDPIKMKKISRHDQLMPYYVMEKMGHIPGLPGLFTVCVFSGALSTLSSGYNALATVTWDDFLKRYYRTSDDEAEKSRVTKRISAVYGLLSIFIAFFIGRLGTVMQASQVLAGSISGPLLGLFLLGFFFPFVDYVAGLSAISIGFVTCLWISVGSLVNKRPTLELPVSVDQCPANMVTDFLNQTGTLPMLSVKNFTLPWEYEPEGLNYIYHLSYWLVPTTGLMITFVIGILVALCRNGLGISKPMPDKKYYSPLVQRFFLKEDETSANLKQFTGIQLANDEKDKHAEKQLDV